MEGVRNATEAVKDKVTNLAQKRNETLVRQPEEDQFRRKATDEGCDKTGNVKATLGVSEATEDCSAHPMETAQSLVDNLSKLDTPSN